MTPYNWATLSWAGGLVVGVVATPLVLRFLYVVTVLSTWHHQGLFAGSAENRLWWLGQYTRTITLPYGLLAIAAVFGWRLSIGNHVPLQWRWCIMIIAAYALIAIVASGGIPRDPEMPDLRQIHLRWGWVLVAGIAATILAVAHFVEFTWLHIALFVVIFFVIVFWTAAAAMAAVRLFLRADHGQSTSYPLD